MIKITIKQGSIVEEKADAIVNPANSYGLMTGGVSKTIKIIGGASIEAEAVRHSPIPIGQTILTDAGMLPYKYIIHSPTVEMPSLAAKEENIRKAIVAALKAADDNKLSKIAMPGMGTGHGGFEPIDGAKLIIDEIKKFKAVNLKEIILIDLSEMMIKAFNDALKEKK
jgi:O-acetyl-ADP-ribose deacetylase